MFYALARAICRILFKLLFHAHTTGEENIPRWGPVLIAPNHVSFLDPVAVGTAARRRLHYMARNDLFAIPLLGWLIKNLNSFPVKKDRPDPEAIKEALRVLKRGEALLLFPEGTRSPDGRLLPGELGIGMLAWHSRAIVIPTAIIGSERALPVGAKWIRSEKIEVRFGKAISPEEFPEKRNRRETYQAISDRIMERIKKLKVES
ncbi:1-acyl-sn-glycerol-3-phosphate acyltransferase [candidate division NPL-UPA2 bacterium]|nr:1-acyl-sn-glycerol-3-phosphate acyltransferase [candidate division NPL-UPA2 bacterium]